MKELLAAVGFREKLEVPRNNEANRNLRRRRGHRQGREREQSKEKAENFWSLVVLCRRPTEMVRAREMEGERARRDRDRGGESASNCTDRKSEDKRVYRPVPIIQRGLMVGWTKGERRITRSLPVAPAGASASGRARFQPPLAALSLCAGTGSSICTQSQPRGSPLSRSRISSVRRPRPVGETRRFERPRRFFGTLTAMSVSTHVHSV